MGFTGRNVEPNNDYCTDNRYCHRLCGVTKHWHPSAVIHQSLVDEDEAWQPSCRIGHKCGHKPRHVRTHSGLQCVRGWFVSPEAEQSVTEVTISERTPESPQSDRYPSLSVAIGWTLFALTGRSSFARRDWFVDPWDTYIILYSVTHFFLLVMALPIKTS